MGRQPECSNACHACHYPAAPVKQRPLKEFGVACPETRRVKGLASDISRPDPSHVTRTSPKKWLTEKRIVRHGQDKHEKTFPLTT